MRLKERQTSASTQLIQQTLLECLAYTVAVFLLSIVGHTLATPISPRETPDFQLRDNNSNSNEVVSTGGLVVTTIGVFVAAIGVFFGWRQWMHWRVRHKVRLFSSATPYSAYEYYTLRTRPPAVIWRIPYRMIFSQPHPYIPRLLPRPMAFLPPPPSSQTDFPKPLPLLSKPSPVLLRPPLQFPRPLLPSQSPPTTSLRWSLLTSLRQPVHPSSYRSIFVHVGISS